MISEELAVDEEVVDVEDEVEAVNSEEVVKYRGGSGGRVAGCGF